LLDSLQQEIGPGDMSAMGVTYSHHRARLMAAVAELVGGGATQVYIMAATMDWRILREEEKRKIPRNLLRKMIRMKLNNDRVNLSEYSLNKLRTISEHDLLPLPLIQLSHKYSLSLSTFMREVEAVLGELWKEELNNPICIQNNYEHHDIGTSQDKVLPRFSTFLSVTQPQQRSRLSIKSPFSQSSSKFQSPNHNWMSHSLSEDSGISSSSSVDSMSCLLLSKKKNLSKQEQEEEKRDSTNLARQYRQVRTQSVLGRVVSGQSTGQVYWDQGGVLPTRW